MAAENQEDTVLDILERNDPEVTSAHIRLDGQFSDAQLAEALTGNPYISKLFLHLYRQQQQARWTALLQVLATKSSLRDIFLADIIPRKRCPAWVVTRFLEVIQQNINITNSFIENASSVVNIRFVSPDIDLPGILPITTALSHNEILDTLILARVKDSTIFHGLQQHGSWVLIWRQLRIFRLSGRPVPSWSIGRALGIVRIGFSTEYFEAVIAAIPQISRTTDLGLHIICDRTELLEAKARLLNALKRNYVLLHVETGFFDDQGEIIDRIDRTNSNRLSFYLNRNTKFAEWLENPESVPQTISGPKH